MNFFRYRELGHAGASSSRDSVNLMLYNKCYIWLVKRKMIINKIPGNRRTWLIALICIIIPFVLLYGAYNYLFGDLCQNEIKRQVKSPDDKLKAVVFSRDCGATASPSAQVSIINAEEQLPNESGNIFVIDDDHSEAVSLDVSIRWTGNRRVEIRHDRSARVFSAKKFFQVQRFPFWQHEQVVIEYVPFAASLKKH